MERFKSVAKVTLLVLCALLLIGCYKGIEADTGAKLELAIKYLSEIKYEEAILTYQEVIRIDPKIVEAYKGMSLAYYMQGENDKAEAILNQGLEQNQDNKYLKLALAGVLIDADKGDQAEKIYLELIQKDQNDLQTYKAYSSFLMNNGREQEAIEKIQQLAKLKKDDYQIHSLLAQQYIENGQVDEAIKAIITSLNLQPEQSLSYNLLKDLYKDDLSQMLELAETMIQEGKKETGELIKIEALYQIGNYQEIVNAYADNKANARIIVILARAYKELEQEDKGKELLKSIKTKDIKDAGMLAYLAESYLLFRDKEQARAIAMQGISLDETVVDNYLVLYNCCKEEEEIGAQQWWVTYLLNSVFSNKVSEGQLVEIWMNSSNTFIDTLNTTEVTAEDVVRDWIKDIEHIQNLHKDSSSSISSNCPWFNSNTGIVYYMVHAYNGPWTIRIGTERGEIQKEINNLKETHYIYKVYNPKIYKDKELPSEFRWGFDNSTCVLLDWFDTEEGYNSYDNPYQLYECFSDTNGSIEEWLERTGYDKKVAIIEIK